MAEESEYKVVYADGTETNWISQPGPATVTYADGSTFTGIFDAEKLKQGAGTYVWMGPGEDEDDKVEVAKFAGEFKDGKKDGRGKMTFPSGDTYDGAWVLNKMEGEGTYIYKASGDIYSGAFVNNKKEGEGRYEFGGDESQLFGTWVGGSITTGSWTLKNAGVYKGSFKNGKPNGEGAFEFVSGISQSGAWVEKREGEGGEEVGEDDEDAIVSTSWAGVPVFSSA